MRYIDNSSLEDALPECWAERSKAALDELRDAANRGERMSILRKWSHVWRDLKAALASLSQHKCWYCETSQVRSDGAVDHFRPKGNVLEAPSHGGYWWIAFDHTNYRFACTFCNSRRLGQDTEGGKADHFPLVDEDTRATGEENDMDDEDPVLLDPTDPADPGLLWFEPDGRAVPKHDKETSELYHLRADTSIRLYHLNEMGTRARRRDRHKDLLAAIRVAARHLNKSGFEDRESIKDVRHSFGRIRSMVKPGADYSAAAMATLLAYRHEYPWLDEIIGTM